MRILYRYKNNDKFRGIKDAEKYITHIDYDVKKLKENYKINIIKIIFATIKMIQLYV